MKEITIKIVILFLKLCVNVFRINENKAFHTVWPFVRRLVKTDRKQFMNTKGWDLTGFIPEWSLALRIAKSISNNTRILIGDSDQEILNKPWLMRQFKEVTLNFGVGGSTTHDWERLFKNLKFKESLLSPFIRSFVICHLGGNNVLQRKMAGSNKSIDFICEYFRANRISYMWVRLPLIVLNVFRNGHPEYKFIRHEVQQINDAIEKSSKGKSFDPAPFMDLNKDGAPDPGTLVDAVHYGGYMLQFLVTIYKHYNKRTVKLFQPVGGF